MTAAGAAASCLKLEKSFAEWQVLKKSEECFNSSPPLISCNHKKPDILNSKNVNGVSVVNQKFSVSPLVYAKGIISPLCNMFNRSDKQQVDKHVEQVQDKESSKHRHISAEHSVGYSRMPPRL